VALFFVIVCTNLQWVATAAAAGPTSLPVWLIGCAAMFVPISVAVMWLSWKYPDEGRMYMWTKRAFGPFAGFMTGWTYWCTNLPYFPALLYFRSDRRILTITSPIAMEIPEFVEKFIDKFRRKRFALCRL
jgi:amino acid transporter